VITLSECGVILTNHINSYTANNSFVGYTVLMRDIEEHLGLVFDADRCDTEIAKLESSYPVPSVVNTKTYRVPQMVDGTEAGTFEVYISSMTIDSFCDKFKDDYQKLRVLKDAYNNLMDEKPIYDFTNIDALYKTYVALTDRKLFLLDRLKTLKGDIGSTNRKVADLQLVLSCNSFDPVIGSLMVIYSKVMEIDV